MTLNLSNRFTALSFTALLLAGFWVAPPAISVASANELILAQAQSRTRIAVLDFDLADTSGGSSVYSFFRGVGPARGIGDLLTNKLVQNGRYSVIERSRIDAVLREQNFGATGRVDASTAAEIGRILGVEYVVLGSITRLNMEEEQSGGSAGICLPFVGCGLGGSMTTRTANVELAARLVNTTTAEIVAAAEGVGSEEKQSGGINIGGIGGGNSSHNNENLVSDAAEQAVEQLVSKLAGSGTGTTGGSTPAPTAVTRPAALIADVSGSQVIINQGTQNGFQTGMVLSIERVDREVTDPQTGRVIRTLTSSMGQIELTDVDAQSGIGKVLSGTGFKVGDRARAVE